nr:unnamed protein product [Digitaria exilis]
MQDTLIGEGTHAKVFLGELKDGRKSAVKKLGQNSVVKNLDGFFSEPDDEFVLQVQAVASLKHDNVVQLLGYCVDGNVRAVIYEYSSRGSLRDILLGTRPGQILSWAQRVKIALSIAQGIEFLHRTKPSIIHSDIKSSNILLFDNDVAKIGDLCISKNRPGYLDDIILDRVCPSPTNCYEAPECKETGEFTRESDIFSFGVVLLELLTGRISGYSQNGIMIGAMTGLSENMVQQCVDPRLGGNYPPKAAAKVKLFDLY